MHVRITHLDRQYCIECGIEAEGFDSGAASLDDRQLRCCRLCGSELVTRCEDVDGPVPGLIVASPKPRWLERGRH
jgi:hypothetical protein